MSGSEGGGILTLLSLCFRYVTWINYIRDLFRYVGFFTFSGGQLIVSHFHSS